MKRYRKTAAGMLLTLLVSGPPQISLAQTERTPAPAAPIQSAVADDDIAGVVTSGSGPEAGVWVIAETGLNPKHYLHDLVSTDKRDPHVNAYGPMYGSTELSVAEIPVLDPVHNTKTTIAAPVRDSDTPSSALANPVFASSPYFGDEQVWDSRFNAHSPVMDRQGRLYFTAQLRSPKNPPAYCAKDSALRSAQLYP